MSVITVLLPIILITVSALICPYLADGFLKNSLLFVGDATVSLLITVLFALFSLGIFKHHDKQQINKHLIDAVKDVASLLLIFGGAGALKQVLTDGGVSQIIAEQLQSFSFERIRFRLDHCCYHPYLRGVFNCFRNYNCGVCCAMMLSSHINPNLMVLSIGAGSMMFSHVNDTGFWLFREYFQLSLKDTIKTWSVMDTLVSVTGLLGVLVLQWFV